MEGAGTASRTAHGTREPRRHPPAQALFAAAIELVSTGAGAFRATARRYSLCVQDAEDAYQRGLEILITKAPTDARDELRPWLHTVIKHEALAVRRQRERMLAGNGDPETLVGGSAPGPEEEAAERERARQTAEALGQLKTSEVQCMLLKALGYSYDEIAARTGFSWTKVNRSLTEGRRRFFERFAQIESGGRCGRFRPLLSAACDGEASSEDRRLLQAHLRGCHPCRAALRDYRSTPSRIAELLPATLVLPLVGKPGWWSRVHDLVFAGAGERAGALGYKLQQASDLVSAQKTAAVVASAAAVAGGAVATEGATHGHPIPRAHAQLEQAMKQTRAPVAPPGGGEGAPAGASPSSPAQPQPPARDASPDVSSAAEFSLETAADPPADTEASSAGRAATPSGGGFERVASAPSDGSATPPGAARPSASGSGPASPARQEFGP